MLTLVLVVIGLIVGAIGGHDAGWFFGAAIGLLGGQWLQLRERIERLEGELAAARSRREFAPKVAPMVAPASPPAASAADSTPLHPLTGLPAESEFAMPQRPVRPRPVSAPPPVAPAPAEVGSGLWDELPTWVTGGNLLVKVGVVILFFGVAFLVKYAAQYGLVPIELRLAGVALAGMALLGLGWRLRSVREQYALALQGGGVGILYLTIFAAFRLYQLLPAGSAFALLVAICALSALLAVVQNALALALLGFAGGFLAPVLASTGGGSHVALFSYYAILNFGILGIAWFRSWRLLNLVGFLFTFVIGSSWGARFYHPDYLSSTEPFLILFVAIFVAAAILHAHRHPPQLAGYVDGTLVFGTPIVAFALQARLMDGTEFGLAWSAVGFGLFYLLCSGLTLLWLGRSARLLAEAFFAFGVIFATLAIPLACDGRWTAAAWALEGSAIVWLGVRQQRLAARLFGSLLILAAGLFFLAEYERPFGALPIFNAFCLGAVLISGAALFAAWQFYREREALRPEEAVAAVVLFVWGIFWWGGAGFTEIERQVPPALRHGAWLAFAALSTAASSRFGRARNWSYCAWSALLLLPLAAALALSSQLADGHPGGGGLLGVWPLALLLLYRILYEQEALPEPVLRAAHAASLWLLTAVVTLEVAWQLDRLVAGAGVWGWLGFGVVPALLLFSVVLWPASGRWPVAPHRGSYLTLGAAPVVVALWLWAGWVTLHCNGDPWPLPYLPLLNPLDIALAFVAVGGWGWARALERAELTLLESPPRLVLGFWGLSLFCWGNGILVRAVHHLAGVPFTRQALAHSFLLQTTLTIAWCLCALTAMIVATRSGRRPLWIVGAALLAVVIGKLFFVDLAGSGTIERIVSFVGVGLFTLVIGWFAPVPPRAEGRVS